MIEMADLTITTDMAVNEHVYSPLGSAEHIRVIRLYPSESQSDRLLCSIKQLKLDDHDSDSYECISYAWGSPEMTRTLHCDDGTAFKITESLHLALTRFRSRRKPRTLWADAVCIHQADPVEKSNQIPLMARIYHGATRVLVWLGSGEDRKSEGFQLLSNLTRTSSVLHEHGEGIEPLGTKVETILKNRSDDIEKFFRLPWFHRRWIIQEVVLNPEVQLHYGQLKMGWSRLLLSVEVLSKVKLDPPILISTALKTILTIGSLWKTWSLLVPENETNLELFELIDTFHHSGCADDKDRLYALMGLATDVREHLTQTARPTGRPRLDIKPDYRLSTEAAYRLFAEQRIQSGRVVSTLNVAGARRPGREPNTDNLMPSWVPDLRFPKLRQPFLLDKTVHVERDKELEVSWDHCGNLCLSSCYIGDVAVVGPGLKSESDFRPLASLQLMRDCWRFVCHSSSEVEKMALHSRDFETMKHLFVRDLIADGVLLDFLDLDMRNRLRPPWPTTEYAFLDQRHREWVVNENTRIFSSLLDQDGTPDDIEILTPFLQLVHLTMRGRRLFRTDLPSGLLDKYGFCIGPWGSEEGDAICTFSNWFSHLIFLRQAPSGYRLLGDGYIAYTYDGALVSDPDDILRYYRMQPMRKLTLV
jgi:Heterokaryon incompatibility protein (HET)